MPAACDKPEPSGPELVSNPGNINLCGCPCNLDPNFRKVFNSSAGKYPARAIAA